MTRPARLLTIAGSDSGGGAGIQADLKTFAAHGVFGMSALTAITAQNTVAVTAVHAAPADVVTAQIDAVAEDIGLDAVKIGMLAAAELVQAVASCLRRHRPAHVVLDPVMVAKSGDSLLEDSAVEALIREMLPVATVVTPNLPEAARLTGLSLAGDPDLETRRRAARVLAELGGQRPAGGRLAVLVKGGHSTSRTLCDLLVDGESEHRFEAERIDTSSTHGTGCTLSSAIAARLGRGEALPEAVGGAIEYLRGAILAAPGLGSGHGPVDHLYRLRATA